MYKPDEHAFINQTMDSSLVPNELKGINETKDFDNITKGLKVFYIIRYQIKTDTKRILGIGEDGKNEFVHFSTTNFDGLKSERHNDGIGVDTFINHPYHDPKMDINYIDHRNNPLLQRLGKLTQGAKQRLNDNDKPGEIHVTAALIANSADEILGISSNAEWHINNGCGRLGYACATGKGYDNCEGCQPWNHGESLALKQAQENFKVKQIMGTTLYFNNHYWITQHCIDELKKAGIKNIVISKQPVIEKLGIKVF